MRWRSVELFFLVAFALLFLVTGAFRPAQTNDVTAGYGRHRVAVAGIIAIFACGVFFYRSLDS